MRDYKIFAAIADIHIGRQSISASSFKKQLKEHFLNVLKEIDPLDGIFICGDILHTIISLNSENAGLFYWFIEQVYKLAKKKNAVVIIIRGTIAHDAEMLDNIKIYQERDDVDFRVYDTIEEITIWDDYKVLVLPDMKVKQLQDVDKYLDASGKYDLILGHGTIDSLQFAEQESEQLSLKTYYYDVDKLIDCCKGPILFGHIHQWQSILNHFYYIGSFTTLERGISQPGFVIGGIYNKDRRKFVINRHINTDGANYYELEVTKKLMTEYPIDEIMETIDEIVADAKENDLITLRIVRSDEKDGADKVLMLEDRYRKDKRFSIVKKVKSKKEEESEERNQALKDKYDYALDPSLSMADIVWRYYQEDFIPALPDPNADIAKLTEEMFKHVLSPKGK